MGYRTLDAVIDELTKRGFAERFSVTGNRLRAIESGRTFDGDDLTILEYQRFEGISDPDDSSVVYAIETDDGTRGLLVDAFGPYADPGSVGFWRGSGFAAARPPDRSWPGCRGTRPPSRRHQTACRDCPFRAGLPAQPAVSSDRARRASGP